MTTARHIRDALLSFEHPEPVTPAPARLLIRRSFISRGMQPASVHDL